MYVPPMLKGSAPGKLYAPPGIPSLAYLRGLFGSPIPMVQAWPLDDGRVFADFVADIVAGRDIILTSDGSARRPFCYLSDATIAYFTVLLRGADGEAYNVGAEEEDIRPRTRRDAMPLVSGAQLQGCSPGAFGRRPIYSKYH